MAPHLRRSQANEARLSSLQKVVPCLLLLGSRQAEACLPPGYRLGWQHWSQERRPARLWDSGARVAQARTRTPQGQRPRPCCWYATCRFGQQHPTCGQSGRHPNGSWPASGIMNIAIPRDQNRSIHPVVGPPSQSWMGLPPGLEAPVALCYTRYATNAMLCYECARRWRDGGREHAG